MTSSFTIAIDGPAAAGKGTISKAVAEKFGFAHLDTGLLYRAVGAKTLAGDDPIDAAQGLTADDMAADNLRTAEVAQAASKVAAISEVRAALTDFQVAFARRAGGAVLDGRDIGEAMVRHGWAVAYERYSRDYSKIEAFSAAASAGIHAGFFTKPEDWRRGARVGQTQQTAAISPTTGNCAIKGNISSNGKIYHMPGQRYYAKTKISRSKGERFFCSEAEAQAAGWRRAQR